MVLTGFEFLVILAIPEPSFFVFMVKSFDSFIILDYRRDCLLICGVKVGAFDNFVEGREEASYASPTILLDYNRIEPADLRIDDISPNRCSMACSAVRILGFNLWSIGFETRVILHV